MEKHGIGNGDNAPLLSHEESVFLLAKQGHLPAQSQLVESHQRMLRGFVAVLCADLSVSDDLAQEAFLRGLRLLNRVEDAAAFPSFLRGIARNVVREHFKKSRRRQANIDRFLEWTEESWEEYQGSGVSGQESGAGDADHHERLHFCLNRLTDRARKIFRLRYEDGLTSDEAGNATSMTAEAVRTANSRTRRVLLTCLKEKLS
jgi:RNA polymerase sigma-70 factor (ECF subfamily)